LENYEGTDRADEVTPANGEASVEGPPPGLGPWLSRNGLYLVILAALAVFLVRKFEPDQLLAILKAAVGLGLVIFIHELGHFLVAKWCDVHVETFSIGFGPALPGCSFRWGETTYMIALFPLGGYVKMVGEGAESEEDDNDPRSFKNKSVGQRMAIISAGVFMNVVLACVCFVFVYTHGMKRQPAVVGVVDSGGIAWAKGIPAGAVLVQIGDTRPARELYFSDLKSEVLRSRGGQTLPVYYRLPPDPEEHRIDIEPRVEKGAGLPMIGVSCSVPDLTLLPEAYPKYRPSPAQFNSPAAAPRKPFGHRPGDVFLSTSDPEQPDRMKPLPPLVAADPKSRELNLFELSQRWQRLAGQPLDVEVRRAGGATEKLRAEPDQLGFGDTVTGMTDPDQGDEVTPLPEDPYQPGSGRGDYFTFRRRLHRLAGKLLTVRVRSAQGETRELVIPPGYHVTLGARMRMGVVAAVREGSPGSKAGVELRDILKRVTLKDKDQKKANFYFQPPEKVEPDDQVVGPERLPYELQKWADSHEGVRVELLVIREGLQNLHNTRRLPEVAWDGSDRWKYDQELPLARSSPLAIPGLGIAYHVQTTVDAVVTAPAEGMDGLEKDDVIKKIRFREAGRKVGESEPGKWVDLEADQWAWAFHYLQRDVEFKEVSLQVERNKATQEITLQAVPEWSWPSDERGFLFEWDVRIQKAANLGQAVALGMTDTYNQIRDVYEHLRGMLTGRISPDNLGGPLTIARVAYGVASADFYEFLFLLGMISVNLAVINFMPIPVLDGGHMVFLIYEKLRGKPAPDQVRAVATYVGLALILCLMVFVIILDVKRL
jgi:regulator of sigma E protease